MAISNSNFFQLQRQSATYVKNGPFSMAKITRGFFFWSSRSHGGSTRGFLIKTSDVSRSVPWVHWTHHETRAFGTNRNLQVFSIPKMHPSHSNSSKIEKWQYAISTFISANHPNHGWKHINVWNSQRVLWLLSILSLSVEFLSQVVLTPGFNLLNLEWWSWICNNGATEMEPIPSRFPISGGFKNRKKTHIFSKAR